MAALEGRQVLGAFVVVLRFWVEGVACSAFWRLGLVLHFGGRGLGWLVLCFGLMDLFWACSIFWRLCFFQIVVHFGG